MVTGSLRSLSVFCLTHLVLVERPCEGVVGGLDGDVSDERDAHVGVRLQAEGDDRDDDEEHGHHASHLKEYTSTKTMFLRICEPVYE